MRSDRASVLALAAILTLQLMLTLDAQVMTVALPTIRDELGFTPAQLSWVPNAYALTFGGLVLLGGRLGDSYGRVRVFLIGTSIFVVASVAGGLAFDPVSLVGARVLQGVGSAIAAPSVLALIITTAKDEHARARGLSYFTAMSAIGASAGLILGGVLTDLASWRWGLLINAPIGITVMIIVGKTLHDTAAVRDKRFDLPGALLATLGSVSLVWAFIYAADHGWTSYATAARFVVAVMLLSLLVAVERRAARPLIAIHLLADRARLGALINMALSVGAHFAMLFMIAQYVQRVLDLSPLMAGISFLPLTATVFLVARGVPALVRQTGPLPPMVFGGALMTVSFLLWSTLDDSSSYLAVLLPLVIHAAGGGLIFVAGTIVALGRVPHADAGSAAGMLQMV
ncbi:MAG: transporter, partial [Nocardioidaceae bacterium]|nr:transporter [Nocardioidaceae bacterium]